MHEILADVVAEQQAVDQFLQLIPERDWDEATPKSGGSIRQHVAILASGEELAHNAIAGGGSMLDQARDYATLDDYLATVSKPGAKRRTQEIIEWWRGARAAVIDELSRTNPSQKIPWVGGSLRAQTFAIGRLTETWVHGLDIHATFDSEPEDTDRLRHIAWLGWETLPSAFAAAGEPNAEAVRGELIGPNYGKWIYGSVEADSVVRGRAGEWCRLTVGRLPAKAATSLKAEGEAAEIALRVAAGSL